LRGCTTADSSGGWETSHNGWKASGCARTIDEAARQLAQAAAVAHPPRGPLESAMLKLKNEMKHHSETDAKAFIAAAMRAFQETQRELPLLHDKVIRENPADDTEVMVGPFPLKGARPGEERFACGKTPDELDASLRSLLNNLISER
jgi:hypothetical protein